MSEVHAPTTTMWLRKNWGAIGGRRGKYMPLASVQGRSSDFLLEIADVLCS
jgi:hypothetical protein